MNLVQLLNSPLHEHPCSILVSEHSSSVGFDMLLGCWVVARGKVIMPQKIKEVDEGLRFTVIFLANLNYNKYSLVDLYLC